MANIPASTSEIKERIKIEDTLETLTDFGQTTYSGTSLPVGYSIHHHNFTVYALDTAILAVDEQMPPTEVKQLVKSHALAQNTII